jgi:hypothetical protein
VTVTQAAPWLRQAASDLRTAKLLLDAMDEARSGQSSSEQFRREDAGCHVAAMCAQTVEKSIKGYMFLNGSPPALDHRPDKYLVPLLSRGSNPLVRNPDHQNQLARIFDQGTRAAIKELLDLTPGSRGKRNDLPNAEYPWTEEGEWRCSPCGAPTFADDDDWRRWVRAAERIQGGLSRLFEAARRESLH